MIGSEGIRGPVALRPGWKGNVFFLAVVAMLVGASVLFILAY
jgi:CRISPR/Cas system-associated protein Csm6